MSDHAALQPLTVGFDIGGTNLRGAVVTDEGRIIDSEQIPTPASSRALEDGVVQIVRQLQCRHEIKAIGIAVAGFLTPDCRTVRYAPHLPWREADVVDRLEERLHLPVRLEHDANSAAWGEYRYGSAQNEDNWVLFAIGTGIGGALMINGRIYRGAYGTAPEFGHICVVPDGRQCSCGKRGCLERYCSGTALATTAREMIGAHTDIESTLLHDYRARPDEITGRHVSLAAHDGDPLAKLVVEDFAEWLGRGLAMVHDFFDPSLIVIGGGVSTDSDLFITPALQAYSHNVVGAGHRPLADIKTATLGAEAGMIGVADLARESFKESHE
ncbi:ROK family glucokinase [Corynebacterium kroppenstedtii]|uniref:ROK family glucokinase n=1 Tax=Corynebacterium sp. PCR 32 TaxID=3351342 RepID=UPI0030980BF6